MRACMLGFLVSLHAADLHPNSPGFARAAWTPKQQQAVANLLRIRSLVKQYIVRQVGAPAWQPRLICTQY